jgi:hypothetical protein
VSLNQRNAKSIVGAAGDFKREANDFYATPSSASRALFAAEKFPGGIWEPSCGDGQICAVAKEFGINVVATDLIDRGYGEGGRDFLNETALLAPNVATNPPFKLAEKFIAHALGLGAEKVAMLLRLQFLEGARRRKMFESTPLARVLVFSKRIPRMHNPDYTGPKCSSLIAFAWFVWERGHNGAAEVRWIAPVEAEKADYLA